MARQSARGGGEMVTGQIDTCITSEKVKIIEVLCMKENN